MSKEVCVKIKVAFAMKYEIQLTIEGPINQGKDAVIYVVLRSGCRIGESQILACVCGNAHGRGRLQLNIIRVTLIGLLAGVLGTGAGGLLALLIGFGAGAGLSFMLAASGGIMISISLMELIPEAVEVGTKGWAALGLLLGVTILFVLDMMLPHTHSSLVVRGKSGAYHGARAAKLRSAGILIGLGIALHNLPEGLAIGAAYAHQQSLGFGVALMIALHNIPEGMAMAVPLRAGEMSASSVVLSTVLAGLPVGIGALIGAWIGQVSPAVLSVCLGFAAGAMMYVVSDELIPEAHFCSRGEYPTIGLVVGVVLGILLILVL